MRRTPVFLVVACACFLAQLSAAGQEEPGDPPLTVCEVLSGPLKYDGRIITIRDTGGGSDEGAWLASSACPGVFTTGGYQWPSTIALETPALAPRFRLHPVDFEYDQAAAKRFERKYRRLRKRLPDGCLAFTVTGLFETRTDWSPFKRVFPNGTWMYIGFGHLNGAPAQVIVRSYDDVEPIPGCSAKRERQTAAPN